MIATAHACKVRRHKPPNALDRRLKVRQNERELRRERKKQSASGENGTEAAKTERLRRKRTQRAAKTERKRLKRNGSG